MLKFAITKHVILAPQLNITYESINATVNIFICSFIYLFISFDFDSLLKSIEINTLKKWKNEDINSCV